MSGGHYNYNQYLLREIAQKIEGDIARALKPKPEKVHENYWTIDEKDNIGSYYSGLQFLEHLCADKKKIKLADKWKRNNPRSAPLS